MEFKLWEFDAELEHIPSLPGNFINFVKRNSPLVTPGSQRATNETDAVDEIF